MKAFIRLIRIPNLLIIILTQVMLRCLIILPLLEKQGIEAALLFPEFVLLVIATVLIAAAGYIINDYFDVDADRVNKAGKVIIGKKIRFENAKIIYYLINAIALLIGLYLAFALQAFQLGLIFLIIIIMLYYYSARYKNMVFWGNLVVGLLSGFTVFIVWLFEFFALRNQPDSFIEAREIFNSINIFVWSYAGFALLTSLVREMIKDIQDMEGDRRIGSKTLPIELGVKSTKVILSILIPLAVAALIYAQIKLFGNGFVYAAWYILIAVESLFIYLLIKIWQAHSTDDYKFLSGLSKVIMLAGILSMQTVYLNF